MRNYRGLLFLLVIAFTSCIGTDEEDAPIVGASISLSTDQVSLLVGESMQVEAAYFNIYGVEEEAELLWVSSNEEVASVNAMGVITAVSAGQTNLMASFGSAESIPLLVTVVKTEDDIANVTISSPQGTQISVGQSIQLEVSVTTVNGAIIEGLSVTFTSLNPDILGVDDQGVITGLMNGAGTVIAEVEGIQSNSLSVQVGVTSRTGSFSGANGYDASGSTELFINETGDLMLSLGTNFDTDFALGTYIYLSNYTSGSVTRNEGLEIQEITSGGSHLFNITSIDPNASIDDYDYVIVLCKPATITFGYAQLTP